MTITDDTTMRELATALAGVKRPIRLIRRRSRDRGVVFTIQVEVTGGSATLTHASLGAVFDTALALVRLNAPEQFAPAVADPEGARIGPAPTPDPTRIGHAPADVHCSVCGFGEVLGQQYAADAPCPNCGESRVCLLPGEHSGNHEPNAEAL